MARCGQVIPGYEAASNKDAIVPSEHVKDCYKPSSQVSCKVERWTTMPITRKVETM